MTVTTPLQGVPIPQPHPRRAEIRDVADKMEVRFLAEMLRHAKLTPGQGTADAGRPTEMDSFLTEAYAERLVERGGIGLSEQIARALMAREGGK
ncbi:MAG: flagellar biosynthesis protein FlgJ [Alphaproteobacteria bacterium]|nr:flagellar biosynthesis protein FlgJ [Alphaproteobacteria bacterium]MDX5369032.1 flagellar biosynthesis protein FlgJ [Alphaproteobacteria bacterium]MDX5463735.1 flagellar biosynthesis protein FlgJ [Alphaproteobacteria bacterium]